MAADCTVHKLVADLTLFSGDRVLLVKYKDVRRYDGQRGWFLPDDHLRHEEHPVDAAKRIATEQAGHAVPDVRLSHIESFGDGAWHLIFHYRAELKPGAHVTPAGNVKVAEWFPLTGLPEPSAVAHHGWALDVLKAMAGGSR